MEKSNKVQPAKAAQKPAKANKSIASKPDAAKILAATQSVPVKGETKLKTVKVNRIPSYDVFSGDDSAAKPGLSEVCKGAYSLAVLITAGMISVSPKGVITAKDGHSNIVAAMAKALHKKCRSGGGHKHKVLYKSAPNIGSGGEQYQLNADGIVFFHNRNTDSGPAFNTEAIHALAMVPQLAKGGELMIPAIMAKPVKLIPCKPVMVRA
jgi:hypothetical protein